MNTNLFQTLMTVVMLILSGITGLLIKMGCTENVVTGAIDCSVASGAPTWLTPYLGMAAFGIGILKMVIAFFEGKLTKPTVAVDK